jgi:pantoate--beta-alanine ligase
LSEAEKKQATCLSRSLEEAAKMIKAGEKKTARLIEAMTHIINDAGPCKIDYISINDLETLAEVTTVARPVLMALAVAIGPARLIDNRILGADGNPILL